MVPIADRCFDRTFSYCTDKNLKIISTTNHTYGTSMCLNIADEASYMIKTWDGWAWANLTTNLVKQKNAPTKPASNPYTSPQIEAPTKPRHMKTWASAEKHSHLWPAHWWHKSPSEMTEFELNHSARWWHGSWRMAAWTNTKEIEKRNCKYYTQIILNNHN